MQNMKAVASKKTSLVTGYIRASLQQLNCFEDIQSKEAKFQFTSSLKLEFDHWVRLLLP